MKNNRILWWTVFGFAGFAAVLLLLKAATLFGHTNYLYIQQAHGRGGNGTIMVMHQREYGTALLFSSLFTAIKLAAFGAAIWLWTKSSGILKGACAAAAGLAVMSLLSPIWGLLLMIALLLLQKKNAGKQASPLSNAGGEPLTYINKPFDSGSFLDEWERKHAKQQAETVSPSFNGGASFRDEHQS